MATSNLFQQVQAAWERLFDFFAPPDPDLEPELQVEPSPSDALEARVVDRVGGCYVMLPAEAVGILVEEMLEVLKIIPESDRWDAVDEMSHAAANLYEGIVVPVPWDAHGNRIRVFWLNEIYHLFERAYKAVEV